MNPRAGFDQPSSSPASSAPADDAGELEDYKLDGDELTSLITSGTVQCTLSDGEKVTLDVDENDPVIQKLKEALGGEEGSGDQEDQSEGAEAE